MIEANGFDLKVPYGNADEFSIVFDGDIPEDGTQIRVTLKPDLEPDTEPIWEKILEVIDGQVIVPLAVSDTSINPGTYFWDIQFVEGPSTPMPPGAFTIKKVVGHNVTDNSQG
jgi:hypothetical protein